MGTLKNAIFPQNLRTSSQSTTKSIVRVQGMQTPFVYHYVEQISGNSLYSIKVLKFLILFHLKFLAFHRCIFLASSRHSVSWVQRDKQCMKKN